MARLYGRCLIVGLVLLVDVCEDKDPTCGPMNGWPNSWCDDPARPYVTELCPLMCKKCTP